MSRDFYIVLHGAKKNVGDFLIRDRAMKLLSHVRGDRDLVEFPSWESLDDKLDIVNKSKAVILMGGPGISEKIYPSVFPLSTNLDDIKVPIILMGSGSYVYPLSYIHKYKLSESSQRFLKKCHAVSVRDNITKNILNNNGISDVTMSGCPAWYDISAFDNKLNAPKQIETIVLSSPQKKVYFPQFVELVKRVQIEFPKAKLIVTFNRGYKKDAHTNNRESEYMTKYYLQLKELKLEIVDLSSDLNKFLEHLNYDFHIGYRLHTHINFISNKKPSYLLAEDSRSYGHCKTLSLPIFRASEDSIIEKLLPQLNEGLLKRVLMHFLPFLKLNENIIDDILNQLKYDISTDFSSFFGIKEKLDKNYRHMEEFLQKLP